jgi:hypothetical protein
VVLLIKYTFCSVLVSQSMMRQTRYSWSRNTSEILKQLGAVAAGLDSTQANTSKSKKITETFPWLILP